MRRVRVLHLIFAVADSLCHALVEVAVADRGVALGPIEELLLQRWRRDRVGVVSNAGTRFHPRRLHLVDGAHGLHAPDAGDVGLDRAMRGFCPRRHVLVLLQPAQVDQLGHEIAGDQRGRCQQAEARIDARHQALDAHRGLRRFGIEKLGETALGHAGAGGRSHRTGEASAIAFLPVTPAHMRCAVQRGRKMLQLARCRTSARLAKSGVHLRCAADNRANRKAEQRRNDQALDDALCRALIGRVGGGGDSLAGQRELRVERGILHAGRHASPKGNGGELAACGRGHADRHRRDEAADERAHLVAVGTAGRLLGELLAQLDLLQQRGRLARRTRA